MKLTSRKKVKYEIKNYDEYFHLVIDTLKIFKQKPIKVIPTIKFKLDLLLAQDSMTMSDLHKFTKVLFSNKFSNSIEYWVERGFEKRIAAEKVRSRAQKAVNKLHESRTPAERVIAAKNANKGKLKYIKNLKQKSPHKLKEQFNTNIEYYLAKGMTEEEAEIALKERQSTFSKEKMIKKFGEKEGLKKVQERNNKWIFSLKKNNDWEILSEKKGRTFEQLKSQYGEETANDIIYNRTKNSVGFKSASKESLIVFDMLIDWLFETYGILYNDIYVGKPDSREYYIRNNKNGQFLYSYDFTIKSLNIIIEYNGEAFHPNPGFSESQWDNWKQPYNDDSATKKRLFDLKKLEYVHDLGFKTLEIWSSKSPENNLEICKKFIENQINGNFKAF